MVDQLIAVKGLGPWTVDMFLIFHLGRPDMLPVGDLGVRRAVQLDVRAATSCPTPAELERIAEPWRPVPLAGEPLPLALARQRAGLTAAEAR